VARQLSAYHEGIQITVNSESKCSNDPFLQVMGWISASEVNGEKKRAKVWVLHKYYLFVPTVLQKVLLNVHTSFS